MIEKIILYTMKNIKNTLHIYSFAYKGVCTDDKFSKLVVIHRGKMELIDLLKQFLKSYCKEVTRKNFNKNLVMAAEAEQRFQSSNKCWICAKLFDAGDNKVRDHSYVIGKYRGSAHWSCNIKILTLN